MGKQNAKGSQITRQQNFQQLHNAVYKTNNKYILIRKKQLLAQKRIATTVSGIKK